MGRSTIWRAGFVFELDGLPCESVRAAFEGELGSASSHDGEEAVSGGEMPRGEGSLPMSEKGARSGKKSHRKKKSGNRKGQLEKGDC